jgi:hypothetical protein
LVVKSVDLIGAGIQLGGQILGFIGGLFTAAAKRIANEIKKSIQKITDEYNNGSIGLNDAITQLEQQRTDAIRRLSGKKGGKDQLNQLLPQLDNELASLRAKQKDVIDSFEAQLEGLRTHSDVLSGFLKTWTDINKQVKEYIAAGGDAAKASEFLSDSLGKLKRDAQDQLDQGEEQAIQDAMHLNDLLKQRIDLEENWRKTQFDILNRGALERRVSNAVSTGLELSQKRQEFQTQLDELNSQITLGQKRVDMERQVFQIAQDTAALKQRSAELDLATLDQELQKLRDYQRIANSIFQGSGGYALDQGFGVSIGEITIQTTPGADGQQLARDFADGLDAELNRRGRYGIGQRIQRTY